MTFFVAALASAETFSGTVVDVMCKGKDLAGHTRSCALDTLSNGLLIVDKVARQFESISLRHPVRSNR